jgi:predicted O-linked N-acetylglucosamine transferase (SPINDLY family)
VRTRTDREIAALSREMEIDIAIDLKGFTLENRIGVFAHRAAPIQVNYLGYPGTMGTPYMDYIIADDTVIPEAARPFYTEKVVNLPGSYQVNDRKRKASTRVFTRAELGLPETGFVFCCFNNSFKISPAVFEIWTRIAKAVEGSVLWLIEDNPTAVANLRRYAQAFGLDPKRLVFAPRIAPDDHLARHAFADLFLDTLPYNAHTTASDALWVGVPLITCPGESFPARVAASLLNAVGLPELIVPTLTDYEALAIALAQDPARLRDLKQKLIANRATAPLFDTDAFTRNIEAAYRHMFENHHAGQPPQSFNV